jgi:hypothetical protein
MRALGEDAKKEPAKLEEVLNLRGFWTCSSLNA